MTIEEDPLSTDARIIKAPKLKYNAASSQPTIVSPLYLILSLSFYNFIHYDRNQKMAHGTCLFLTLLNNIILMFAQFRIDKKFYEPGKIVRWAVIIYDSMRNFPEPAYKEMVRGFLKACGEVGK